MMDDREILLARFEAVQSAPHSGGWLASLRWWWLRKQAQRHVRWEDTREAGRAAFVRWGSGFVPMAGFTWLSYLAARILSGRSLTAEWLTAFFVAGGYFFGLAWAGGRWVWDRTEHRHAKWLEECRTMGLDGQDMQSDLPVDIPERLPPS